MIIYMDKFNEGNKFLSQCIGVLETYTFQGDKNGKI